MKILSTEVENIVLNIWLEVFNQEMETSVPDSIKADDNFFELGGDSIMAMQVIARLKDKFKIPLSLGTILKNPTINHLTATIMQLTELS